MLVMEEVESSPFNQLWNTRVAVMKRSFQVVCLMTTAVVICVVAYAIGCKINRTMEEARDAYAVEWVAGMIIEHLKANGDEWPESWEDLRDEYERMADQYGHPWRFDSLRSRVAVEFDVRTSDLSSAKLPTTGRPFNVVYLRNGKETHWEEGEPNRLIFEYLTKEEAKAEIKVHRK